MIHSPYVRKPVSEQRTMGLVLVALLPGIAAYVWQAGTGILVNLLIATLTAVLAEAHDRYARLPLKMIRRANPVRRRDLR